MHKNKCILNPRKVRLLTKEDAAVAEEFCAGMLGVVHPSAVRDDLSACVAGRLAFVVASLFVFLSG